MFRGGIDWWMPLAGIGPFVALRGGRAVRAALAHGRQDKDFPRIARFANALIETSLPSVIIFVLASHMEPRRVFGFWPPMLYFVFIVLSTLRLDFWLSLWTGAVAAVQQFAAGRLAACRSSCSATVPEHALVYHLSRSVVLLGAGVVAGIVAGSLRRQFEKSVAAAAARDRVTNLFGQHVSPAVVDRLLATRSSRRARCARSACCSSTSGASPP